MGVKLEHIIEDAKGSDTLVRLGDVAECVLAVFGALQQEDKVPTVDEVIASILGTLLVNFEENRDAQFVYGQGWFLGEGAIQKKTHPHSTPNTTPYPSHVPQKGVFYV